MSKKNYHSAKSGRYVSQEEAAASADSTVAENPMAGSRKHAYEFLKLLVSNGGSIVSSNDCTVEEIAAARAEKRFYVDADSFGYVYVPKKAAEESDEA
jgi:hypothetical protein